MLSLVKEILLLEIADVAMLTVFDDFCICVPVQCYDEAIFASDANNIHEGAQ